MYHFGLEQLLLNLCKGRSTTPFHGLIRFGDKGPCWCVTVEIFENLARTSNWDEVIAVQIACLRFVPWAILDWFGDLLSDANSVSSVWLKHRCLVVYYYFGSVSILGLPVS